MYPLTRKEDAAQSLADTRVAEARAEARWANVANELAEAHDAAYAEAQVAGARVASQDRALAEAQQAFIAEMREVAEAHAEATVAAAVAT